MGEKKKSKGQEHAFVDRWRRVGKKLGGGRLNSALLLKSPRATRLSSEGGGGVSIEPPKTGGGGLGKGLN